MLLFYHERNFIMYNVKLKNIAKKFQILRYLYFKYLLDGKPIIYYLSSFTLHRENRFRQDFINQRLKFHLKNLLVCNFVN